MVLWVTAVTIAALGVAVLLVGLAMRDGDLATKLLGVLWGFGFVVVAWVAWLIADGHGVRTALLVSMATAWGLRLGIYLAFRNLGQRAAGSNGSSRSSESASEGSGEHARAEGITLAVVMQTFMQSAAMWVLALPVQIGIGETSRGWTPLWVVGAVVFLAGFLFEAIGDWQLARFKANPASVGQVLDTGLWRYTRHPNYFGDTLAWWGIGLVAASTPIGIIGLIGPAFNHWTLLKVSGVPALEGNLKDKRPGYADYIQRTSTFVPRRPKQL
ncbi:MAG: DUF1295 domain-containing protein [bacterium]|nr:DUF1295 domain-containing protein [bacterium]